MSLERARLVLLSADKTQELDTVEFDFNPHTLTIQRTTAAEAPPAGSRGASAWVAGGRGSLSFEAVFDTTRATFVDALVATATAVSSAVATVVTDAVFSLAAPASASGSAAVRQAGTVGTDASKTLAGATGNAAGASATGDRSGDTGPAPVSPGVEGEARDVRRRTWRILRALDPAAAPNKRPPAGGRPSPLVRFVWGPIAWEGLLHSASETLDYFSPSGVPLRSKLQIRIDEASELRRDAQGDRSAIDAAERLAASLSAIRGSAPRERGLPPTRAVDPGAGIDLAFGAAAGLPLDAASALELFGAPGVDAAFGPGADLGFALPAGGSGSLLPLAPRGVVGGAPSPTPTPWAPNGPAAGTAAAALAGLVREARATGGATGAVLSQAAGMFVATDFVGPATPTTIRSAGSPARAAADRSATPIPVVGSPPLRRRQAPEGLVSVVWPAPGRCGATKRRP